MWPLTQNPDPLGFFQTQIDIHWDDIANPIHMLAYTPLLQCRRYLLLHYYSLVLLMPRRAAPSPSIAQFFQILSFLYPQLAMSYEDSTTKKYQKILFNICIYTVPKARHISK
jgi:hypothetical protein